MWPATNPVGTLAREKIRGNKDQEQEEIRSGVEIYEDYKWTGCVKIEVGRNDMTLGRKARMLSKSHSLIIL